MHCAWAHSSKRCALAAPCVGDPRQGLKFQQAVPCSSAQCLIQPAAAVQRCRAFHDRQVLRGRRFVHVRVPSVAARRAQCSQSSLCDMAARTLSCVARTSNRTALGHGLWLRASSPGTWRIGKPAIPIQGLDVLDVQAPTLYTLRCAHVR